jgi:hypothetical protein
MITIQNLEVKFEVEGDDKQRFAALFTEFIHRWAAEVEVQRQRDHRSARDRSLGDMSHGAG